MTDGITYLAALVLAIVFAYSAIAKLRDAQPTRRALDAAGLPGGVALVKAIAAAEAMTAVLLMVRPSTGAVLAVVLLSAFTLFVALLLARKIDVSCGCFGANASDSVSAVDVVRNVLLLALAGTAIASSGPSGIALEEVIVVTTAIAIGTVLLTAMATRRKLGQLFDNRLPGGL